MNVDEQGRPAVVVVIQNLPLAVDRRVRLECRALVLNGYHVSVICPRAVGQTASYHVAEGVHVYSYPPPPSTGGVLSYFWEFVYCWVRTAVLSVKVQREQGFRVLQACNPPDTFWLLALLWRVRGVRFVYDQHDLCPEVYRSRFGVEQNGLVRALLWLERRSYRTAHHVVSTNASYKRTAMARGGKAERDVTVVRSGPDPSRMRRGEAREELKQGRAHLCVYLGVMGPQDGVDHLVRSIAHIVHVIDRTDIHFAVLGFGDALPSLRALTTRLELDDYVTFTGRADDDMIAAYLSTADIGLSPDPSSPLNDVSTMNKTLEYMSYELPVVAYDLPETVVSAGDAAVYATGNDEAEFARAVVGLLDRPAERIRRGAVGRRRIVESLAWEHSEARYVGVFDSLLGRERVITIPAARPAGAATPDAGAATPDAGAAVRVPRPATAAPDDLDDSEARIR